MFRWKYCILWWTNCIFWWKIVHISVVGKFVWIVCFGGKIVSFGGKYKYIYENIITLKIQIHWKYKYIKNTNTLDIRIYWKSQYIENTNPLEPIRRTEVVAALCTFKCNSAAATAENRVTLWEATPHQNGWIFKFQTAFEPLLPPSFSEKMLQFLWGHVDVCAFWHRFTIKYILYIK